MKDVLDMQLMCLSKARTENKPTESKVSKRTEALAIPLQADLIKWNKSKKGNQRVKSETVAAGDSICTACLVSTTKS